MKVIVYSKRNCAACKMLTCRLERWGIPFVEIFDHNYSAPTIMSGGRTLFPPITTQRLKKWLASCQS